MKKLGKRMNTETKNMFHKSACSCLTTCIIGCSTQTGMWNAEKQVRPNQRADGVRNGY